MPYKVIFWRGDRETVVECINPQDGMRPGIEATREDAILIAQAHLAAAQRDHGAGYFYIVDEETGERFTDHSQEEIDEALETLAILERARTRRSDT